MIVRCSSCCGRRVGRVARAVVEPRVDEVAHVDDVDPVVAGERERVDRRLQEEVARVLAGAQVHEPDIRGDSRHPEAVQRRRDRPGHMRAVAVLVHVRRVVAGAVRLGGARPVDERDVDGEVAAQRRVEVRERCPDGCRRCRCRARRRARRWSPGSTPYEPEGVAWIIAMSHCRPPSGSAAGAGRRAGLLRPDGGALGGGQALGRSPSAGRRRVVADRLVARDAAPRRPGGAGRRRTSGSTRSPSRRRHAGSR